MSIRLNRAKLPALAHPTLAARWPVPWCATGRHLSSRPVFTLDPLLHAGAYYVQEAGSMLLEQAVRATGLVDRPILALDLCAAPGGKSTHLLSLLHDGSLLVSNEPVRARQASLMENIWKWGVGTSVITGALPEHFAASPVRFDLVLVDAPCSGEGMFRKDPFARQQWSPALVRQCAALQRSILDHAWAVLKPGGSLIYSTCTWERSENEDQMRRLGREHGAIIAPIPIDGAWNIDRSDEGLRCYPHRTEAEGSFLALLLKPDERHDHPSMPGGGHHLIEVDGIACLMPEGWMRTVDTLRRHLRVLSPGLPAFDRRRGVARPHAALALHADLHRLHDAGPLPLNTDQALRYLRGEALREKGARGDRRVEFNGLPLGWAHGAGDRWNSGWPKGWRIRMA